MSISFKKLTTIFVLYITVFSFPLSSAIGASLPKTTADKPSTKLYGVNRSGAEFAPETLPGKPGVDFEYPTDKARFEAFVSRGLTLMRVPILWERVQPKLNSGLNPEALLSLNYLLDTAESAHLQVILDLHNYGRYYGRPLEVSDARSLAHFWVTLITALGNKQALYGVELMNEPHDLPGGEDAWAKIVQQTVSAIRQYNNKTTILVPGYSWQSARFWHDNNKALIISDPANKLLYSAHQYFDSNFTGTYGESTTGDASRGSELLAPFVSWLKENNLKGIITEYGAPSTDPVALSMMRNMLSTVDNSDVLVGAVYWASGPRWGSYQLSVEPDSTGKFPGQIDILQDFPTRTNPVAIPRGLKKGDFVKFEKNLITYYVDTNGLHPLVNTKVYQDYKIKNKTARVYTRTDSVAKYTVRFTPIANISGE